MTQWANDPAQVDRAWSGYHPRAAVPALVTAAAASLLVWTGKWFIEDLSTLADRVGALAVFAVAWCVWPVLLAVYLYRAITYAYRVTDRAVLIDFGFRNKPVLPIPLSEITTVQTGAGTLSALLGVGWVELRTAERTVRLLGVRRPDALAELIRAATGATLREPAKG